MADIDAEMAREALRRLLWELPAEFAEPPRPEGRSAFRVIKRRNVLAVHRALWDLQVVTGLAGSAGYEEPASK